LWRAEKKEIETQVIKDVDGKVVRENGTKTTYTYDSSKLEAQKEKVKELKKLITELVPGEKKGKSRFSEDKLKKNYKFMDHELNVMWPEEYTNKKGKTKTRFNIKKMACDYDPYAEVAAWKLAHPPMDIDDDGNDVPLTDEQLAQGDMSVH
jgi:hypothetical protein